MTKELMAYLASMQKSHAGEDYDDASYQPVDPWNGFGKKNKKK